MKDNCQWLNFQWGLDIQYTHVDEAPILAELCRKHGRFWDGENWHMIQAGKVILRWPDWRKNYLDYNWIQVQMYIYFNIKVEAKNK